MPTLQRHLPLVIAPPLLATALAVAVSPALAQPRPQPPGSTEVFRLVEPRVAPLPEPLWTAEHRALVARYAPEIRIGNAFRTLLHVPELVEAVMPFVLYTAGDSTLPARDRELLILRTAWLCQNSYLWADHAPTARILGIGAEEMLQIAQGPAAGDWDPFEATLLRLPDELFHNSSVSGPTWAALEEHYDLRQLIDAVMTVNQTTLLSMLFNSLGVQPDEAALARLPTEVPYRLDTRAPDPPLRAPRVDPIEGPGLRVTRTFARHPRMAAARSGQSRYVNSVSPLTPHFRELLILRIGWNCQAVYEWAKHVGSVGRARDHDLDPERIARGPDAGWNDFEQAHLHAADEIYRDGIISHATWSALAERYDTRELLSVVMTVANYRLVSMSLNALGVQPQDTDELFPALR
ncbi:MAG: carboxymuconolactone decarboxylase family protein [Acidobacteriota bacterium]|nr:carboxymuconolactone decarboxylase family protein [Acidobacteriota bacterium]